MKGPSHGARHGKTEVQREYHLAWNVWKRCCKKVDSQGGHFTGFTIDFSEIQLIVNLSSQSDGQKKSAKSGMNLQKKTIHIISLQRKRKDTKDAGKNGPMKLRSDFRAAVLMKNRLHHESGEQWRASLSRSTKTMAFIFKHIVVGQVWMELEVSSYNFLIVQIFFCYSWFRLQSIAIHCNRRGSEDRYTSHETLSQTHWPCARITLRLKVSQRVSDKITHAHVITCLSVRCLFLFCLLALPLALLLSLSLSTCSLSCSSTSMSSKPPRNKTTALTHNEECCPVAIHNPFAGYEPNLLDNFDYSETSPAILQDESGDIDTEPSYSCDAELDDEINGKALSSPLLIQEREEPANLRQTLWKMVQDHTQYLLNKDLQHLKWQQLRSWISSPDCQVAMDKHQTQYQLMPE